MRRNHLTALLAGAIIIAAGGGRAAAQQTPQAAARPDNHVVFITAAPSDSTGFNAGIARGIRFGADEAARTATLTGARFDLETLLLPAPADSARSMAARASIIITAVPIPALDSVIGPLRVPVLDVTPWNSPTTCATYVLRLSPGAAVLRQARVWHPALERFGAQQLNERYRRFSGQAMDDNAFLGWLAAKLAFELPLRARTTHPDSLAAFARSGRARFDGHKGIALSFDSVTGVLSQPLYQKEGAPPAEVDEPMNRAACR